MNGLRWIAFDAVGTLIDADPPVSQVYHAVGLRHRSRRTLDEVGRRFRAAFARQERRDLDGLTSADWSRRDLLATSESRERARWRAIVSEVFDDVADPEACLDELWRHFAQPRSWRCFPDVRPALRRLREEGFRLAVASNFDERLPAICAALPALSLIEHVIVSTSAGYRKPSCLFFEALAAACGCDASRILMVGDDFTNDIQGARAAGLQAVLLDRTGDGSDPAAIRSLEQLSTRGKSAGPARACERD